MSTLPDIPLHVVSQTSTTITLGWTEPVNTAGYLFTVNGAQVSRRFNPSVTTERFAYDPTAVYGVTAVSFSNVATGTYSAVPVPPPPLPPPPPPPPTGTPAWDGRLSSGNFVTAGWTLEDTATMGAAAVGSDTKITLVTTPAPPAWTNTQYWAKCETYADSTGQTASKARAEMRGTVTNTAAIEGKASQYIWPMLLTSADNGNLTVGWKVLSQFASGLQFNCPGLLLYPVNGVAHLFFDTFTGPAATPHRDLHIDLGPIKFDHPYKVDLRVLWSMSKATGKVHLLLDDVEVVPAQAAQTKPSDGVAQFAKQGAYRSESDGGANFTVHHGGLQRFDLPGGV